MKLRFTRGEGLELGHLPFAVDAGRSRPLGIISHAHTDHSARHKRIITTPETALLLGERWKRLTVRALPFGQTLSLEGARLTLLASGHVLGSAMVRVEHEGTRVLYTGDLRTRDSLLFPGAEPVSCDTLVIEATFGRPEYKFPTAARTKQMVRAFVDAARASGYTPVLTGYALGKAQELVAILGGYHEPIWVHPKIAAFSALYRKAGIALPAVEIPSAGAPPGALVVMPPNFGRTEWRERVRKPRICFCSGWAVDARGIRWYAADQAIPLSDHADCEDLLAFARATGARKVYTVHGFAAELAELLRGEGIDAEPAPDRWHAPEPVRPLEFSSETLDLFNS